VDQIINLSLEKESIMVIEKNIKQRAMPAKDIRTEISSNRVIKDSMFVVKIKDNVRCAIMSALQVLDTQKLGKTGVMAMEVSG